MPRQLFAVIVNPRGGRGKGRAILEQVEPAFAAGGASLEVLPTSHPGHAAALAGSLDVQRYAGLAVIGGDGTVQEVVHGLLGRDPPARIPLGVIPAGTGNTLHNELGGLEPAAIVRNMLGGQCRRIDAMRVLAGGSRYYCLSVVGWGAAAHINRTAERLRGLGRHRYSLAALAHILTARPTRVRFAWDEQQAEEELLLGMVCNTSTTGRGMKLAPHARLDDGLLDLVLLRPCSRWQMLSLLSRVLEGTPATLPAIVYRQVKSFAILDRTGDLLHLDGEVKGTAPLQVEVLPGTVEIFA